MHEYPITMQIVKIALEHAQKHHAARITRITLVVGEKSGYIGDSIQMYFDIIARGTLAEGATLDIQSVKPQLKCSACGLYFERKPFSFACPSCGQEGNPTEIGKEFYLKDIEIVSEKGGGDRSGNQEN